MRPPPHIQVTSLKHDQPGAVMFVYCPICKHTVIALSEHASRPINGDDAWYLNDFCEQMHFDRHDIFDPKWRLFVSRGARPLNLRQVDSK